MIVKFLTRSGSEYEYDSSTPRLVRRVKGARAPTARQQQDGEWYQCQGVTNIYGGELQVGFPAVIWWGEHRYAFVDGANATTVTSSVTEIVEREQ